MIVADDGSEDDSAVVAREHGALFLPGDGRRHGFAVTVNRGIAASTSGWIMPLNNDTEVRPDAFAQLLDAARRTGADVVCPLVVSLRDPAYCDSAGLRIFRDGTARPWLHTRPRVEAPADTMPLLLPSGSAFCVRREVWERIGVLDESLQTYLEDLDWGLRAGRAGVPIVLEPRAVVHHWFSGTEKAISPYKARMVERNHIVVAVRHLPPEDALLLPLWTAARWGAMVALAMRQTTNDGQADSKAALAAAAARGLASGVAAIPAALAERRRLARRYPTSGRRWRRMLAPHRARLGDYRHFGL